MLTAFVVGGPVCVCLAVFLSVSLSVYLSRCLSAVSLSVNLSRGAGTSIYKLYGDVPPFRVWFFDYPVINRVSKSTIFEAFL